MCPNTQQLQALLDGQLSGSELADVQSHLESCEACQQRLEELVAGKESWSGAREQLAAIAQPHGAALDAAIEQAKMFANTQNVPVAPEKVPEKLDFLQPSDQPNMLGRLNHYEVMDVVGRGGMGVVLKAFDSSLRRVVAIKLLAGHLASCGNARRRFVREAQAAAAVSHDHVVAIHAVEGLHDPPYFVMQFIAGKTLQQRIDANGPMALKEVLRIGMQTAAGLAAAHAQGLVHRDVKPANILLENGVERVKLTDFGLARASDDASLTQTGVVSGTPQYMAPEQAAGQSVDYRADLFSLGGVLYAMCTGRPPFRASTTVGVLKKVCDEMPRPVREINPEVPEWLEAIIQKLLAKRPEERFGSAREVSDLLGQFLANLQHPASAPLPEFARAEPVTARNETATVAGPTPLPAAPTRPAGTPWLLVLLVTCAVLGICGVAAVPLGIFAYWLMPAYSDPTKQPTISRSSATYSEVEPEPADQMVTRPERSMSGEHGVSWGPPSEKGVRLGLALDPAQASYELGDVVRIRLLLRNSGVAALSPAVPRFEVLEKFDFDLVAEDSRSTPIPWSWGTAHKSREELSVSGANSVHLPPDATYELADAAIVLGKPVGPASVFVVLEAKAGQTCRLTARLGTYGYAQGQGEPLESGPVAFQVTPAATASAPSPSADVIRELTELNKQLEEGMTIAQERHKAGVVSIFDVVQAEQAVIQGRIRLATVARDRERLAPLYDELVKLHESAVAILDEQFKAGTTSQATVTQARKELAEARIQAASARENP